MAAETQDSPVEVDKPFGPKVETMAGYGLSPADIALVLALDESEIRSVYKREMETGSLKANLRVAESLFRKATSDGPQSVAAAIFWAKTRMGCSEKSEPATVATTEIVIKRFAVEWQSPSPQSADIRGLPRQSTTARLRRGNQRESAATIRMRMPAS